MAPSTGRAPEMHPVPSAGNLNVPDIHVIARLKEDGVVGGIHNRNIPNVEFVATNKGQSVWSPHVFLASGVEDFVAVNASWS